MNVISHNSNYPDWIDNFYKKLSKEASKSGKVSDTLDLSQLKDVRLNIKSASSVNEVDIVKECNYIDKISQKTGSRYYINKTWPTEVKAHLVEYACSCGMKCENCIELDPEIVVEASKKAKMVRTASTNVATEKEEAIEWDGFGFDEIHRQAANKHMEKSDWEKVEPQQVLGDKPSLLSGSIVPIRGGEVYEKTQIVGVQDGQNSIVDPDALERLANSEKEDVRTKIRKAKEARMQDKQAQKDREIERLARELKKYNLDKKTSVFATEVMNANPGLNTPDSQIGVFRDYDVSELPKKTKGEMLRDKNKERSASIKREQKADTWEKPSRPTKAEISDLFGESLDNLKIRKSKR